MSSSGGVDESTSVLSLSTTDQLPMVRSIVAPGAGRPDRVDGSHADVVDHPLQVRPTSAMSSIPAAASLPCHVRQSASLPLAVSSEFLSTTFGAGDPICIRQSDGAARASNASHPSGELRRRPIDGRPRASYVSVAQIAERLVILGQISTPAHLTTAVLPMTMGWTEGYQHFPTETCRRCCAEHDVIPIHCCCKALAFYLRHAAARSESDTSRLRPTESCSAARKSIRRHPPRRFYAAASGYPVSHACFAVAG
ncbi:hypothetical protein ACVWWN_004049 [Mycobacterium sp. URHB0021]